MTDRQLDYYETDRSSASRTEQQWRTYVRLVITKLTDNWVVELGALVGLAVAYNIVRAGAGNDADLAIHHSHLVIALEGPLFEHVEVVLNHWLITVPAIAVFACYFYALMHYAMTPLVLLVSRKRGGAHYWRGYWALVLASAIGLTVYALFPVAPPRLVPDLDIVDVMRRFADTGWWGGAASAPRGIGDATNQFAAMPSLHFGWSLWCAIQMWGLHSRWWRVPAVLYPTIQAGVVLATGNHFLLDIAAGAACVLVAYAVAGRVTAVAGTRAAAAGGEPRRLRPGTREPLTPFADRGGGHDARGWSAGQRDRSSRCCIGNELGQ